LKKATLIRKQVRFREQVSTASGLAFSKNSEKVWMFDNEIDWVTHLEVRFIRREAYDPG
jgi:hypothetical protein